MMAKEKKNAFLLKCVQNEINNDKQLLILSFKLFFIGFSLKTNFKLKRKTRLKIYWLSFYNVVWIPTHN